MNAWLEQKLERFLDDHFKEEAEEYCCSSRDSVSNDTLAEKLDELRDRIDLHTQDSDGDLEFIKERVAWFRPFDGYAHPESNMEPPLPKADKRTFLETENPDLVAANARISAGADLKTAAKRLLDRMNEEDQLGMRNGFIQQRKELAEAIEKWCNLEAPQGGS